MKQQRVDDGAPASITGAVAGDTNLVGLVFVALGSQHAGFEVAQVADRFAAEHHGNHDDQQHGRRAGIRCHTAAQCCARIYGCIIVWQARHDYRT